MLVIGREEFPEVISGMVEVGLRGGAGQTRSSRPSRVHLVLLSICRRGLLGRLHECEKALHRLRDPHSMPQGYFCILNWDSKCGELLVFVLNITCEEHSK